MKIQMKDLNIESCNKETGQQHFATRSESFTVVTLDRQSNMNRNLASKLKERVHSEMKILSIPRFILLIMPIVLIFFRPVSLAGWIPDTVMLSIRSGYSDACPQMLRCKSPDVQILLT